MKAIVLCGHVMLAVLLGCAGAQAEAGEAGRARAASLLEFGLVLGEAAASAARSDDPARRGEILLGGTGVGALQGCVGAALEVLAQGPARGAARGACKTGAAAGAAAGAADAQAVAERDERNRRELASLREAAERVQQDNQALARLLAAAQQSLRDAQARLVRLRADVDARQISAAQAEALRRHEQQNIESLQAALDSARASRARHGQQARSAGGSDAEWRALDQEIARMDRQIAELERQLLAWQRALAVSRA
ncbi:hypothetical protein [Piscinibacter defluvii]|uniref:hypothetical protein n=1 Tax=Piscinibacter defluvii TaxID=1796922 RepID=UPI000FDDB305|nr:hypothetical protein [Piscinibacter defluvii]